MFLDRTAPKEPPRSGKPQAKLWCPRGRSCSRVDTGCLRCLLLVICTHPFAKEALTLHLARSEGHERYFGCNLMHRRVLASSHQHLIAEAPDYDVLAQFFEQILALALYKIDYFGLPIVLESSGGWRLERVQCKFRNSVVNFWSRSTTRNRLPRRKPSNGSVRFRPTCRRGLGVDRSRAADASRARHPVMRVAHTPSAGARPAAWRACPRRRYQPTEARPSTPLSVPPINGLSRRCTSTPNSNFTPSPPNAARL